MASLWFSSTSDFIPLNHRSFSLSCLANPSQLFAFVSSRKLISFQALHTSFLPSTKSPDPARHGMNETVLNANSSASASGHGATGARNAVQMLFDSHLHLKTADAEILFSSIISANSFGMEGFLLAVVLGHANNGTLSGTTVAIYALNADSSLTSTLVQSLTLDFFVTALKFVLLPQGLAVSAVMLVIAGDNLLVSYLSQVENKKLSFFPCGEMLSFDEFKLSSRIHSFDVIYHVEQSWSRYSLVACQNGLLYLSMKTPTSCNVISRVFDSMSYVSLALDSPLDASSIKPTPVSLLHDRAQRALVSKPRLIALIGAAHGSAYLVNFGEVGLPLQNPTSWGKILFLQHSDKFDSILHVSIFKEYLVVGTFGCALLLYSRSGAFINSTKLSYPVFVYFFIEYLNSSARLITM